ncbi:MAG: hypothetical protein ABID79_04380 [Elusimicrobiota bacterium]
MLKFDNDKLKIYLIDRKVDIDLSEIHADIFWIEDMGIPNFYELAFKYDITELSTSLKPCLTLRLLKQFEKVIFLDSDTCLYHSVEPILSDLDNHSIVLTPHYTTPQSDDLSESDIGMMRFGSFNLGFYAVKNSEQGIYFLTWWSDRCLRFGFFETQFGLSTDQKWVSVAPCFFKDLHISFNLGYNVAFWNVHERSLKRDNDHEGCYLVNDIYPLIFFHFSSFDESNPEYLSKRPFSEKQKKRADLLELSKAYKQSLYTKKIDASLVKYGFDYTSDGEYISPTLRRAYACVLSELPSNRDPFDSKGIVGVFARRNFLFEKSSVPYVSNTYSDIPNHKRKFAAIYFVMRVILRLIGPNKFSNLSRLLVYLSSYRQNRGLWKY